MRLLLPFLLVLSPPVWASSLFVCYNGTHPGSDPSQTALGQMVCPQQKRRTCLLSYNKIQDVMIHMCGGKKWAFSCPENGFCKQTPEGYLCCCNSPLCNLNKPEDFVVDGKEERRKIDEQRTCLDGEASLDPSDKRVPLQRVECKGQCTRTPVKVSYYQTKYRLGCASKVSGDAWCRGLPICKPSPEGKPEACCCTGKDCNSLPWTSVEEQPSQPIVLPPEGPIVIPPEGPEEPTVDGPRRRNKNPLKNLSKKAETFFRFLLKQLNCIFNFFGL